MLSLIIAHINNAIKKCILKVSWCIGSNAENTQIILINESKSKYITQISQYNSLIKLSKLNCQVKYHIFWCFTSSRGIGLSSILFSNAQPNLQWLRGRILADTWACKLYTETFPDCYNMSRKLGSNFDPSYRREASISKHSHFNQRKVHREDQPLPRKHSNPSQGGKNQSPVKCKEAVQFQGWVNPFHLWAPN